MQQKHETISNNPTHQPIWSSESSSGSSWLAGRLCSYPHELVITIDWQRMDDEFGNIKGKYIEAAFLFKGEYGCGYMSFGFLKGYLGDGQYAKDLRQYTAGNRGELSCNKVN